MAEEKKYLAPGTLEQTRRNIGQINKEEAAHMMKVLGGEVLQERYVPPASSGPKTYAKASGGGSSGASVAPIKQMTAAEAAMASANNVSKTGGAGSAGGTANAGGSAGSLSAGKKSFEIKNITPADWIQLDRVMMSPEYRMKSDYGFFNFVRHFQRNGLMRLDKTFIKNTLSRHISHMEAFVTLTKTLVTLSPVSFQNRVKSEDSLQFRFLRKVSSWDLGLLSLQYSEFRRRKFVVQISDMGPFTKAIYGLLVQIMFLGERRVTALLKDIYENLLSYPDTKRSVIANTIKDTAHEWTYIYNNIIKGLYPLLYAMLGGPFISYDTFFSRRGADILKFTDKSRFDVLLPVVEASPEDKAIAAQQNEIIEETKESEEEIQQKKEERAKERRKKDLVRAGLKILETVFPQAGFSNLDKKPDLYPYFQPLFDFPDGFNLLSPENPLQVIVILLRILEDLFQGCRNINFVYDTDTTERKEQDSILTVLNEWTVYREVLFDKSYAQNLRDFVTEQYTKREFSKSQYGKTLQNKLFWLIKYHFLPHYTFDKLVLERPEQNHTYRPLSSRISFIVDFFSEIVQAIDSSKKQVNSAITGVQNPWAHYSFGLKNVISERLDILLVAKRTGEGMTATNANLLKYTLCIAAVLDWWINDSESPAYKTDPFKFYRISPDDGGPLFTVPLRDDQDKLFRANLKRLAQAQAASKAAK